MNFAKIGASNPATQARTPKAKKHVVRPALMSEYRAIKATIEAEQHAKAWREQVKRDKALKPTVKSGL